MIINAKFQKIHYFRLDESEIQFHVSSYISTLGNIIILVMYLKICNLLESSENQELKVEKSMIKL